MSPVAVATMTGVGQFLWMDAMSGEPKSMAVRGVFDWVTANELTETCWTHGACTYTSPANGDGTGPEQCNTTLTDGDSHKPT